MPPKARLGNYLCPGRRPRPMDRRTARTRPLSLAMRRMQIPLRRIRQGFETRDVRDGGLYGKVWWRRIGGARGGGFFGVIKAPGRWAPRGPGAPGAVALAFARPRAHPLHQRLVARKGSLFETVSRRSRYEGV